MDFKAFIVVLALGIAIGYVAKDYYKELELAKKYVLELSKKATAVFTSQEKPVTPQNAEKKPKKTSSSKDKSKKPAKDLLFTKDELWEHYRGGEGSKGLYIAIMGRVYDVAKGAKHYAPGGGYSFFAGRDGTKAYSTGEFNEKGLTDDLSGIDVKHFGEYENWVKFFDTDYTYVGKVIGNFYDENGEETDALKDAHEKMKQAQKIKDDEKAHEKKFPRCNSEWSQKKGSRVWCTTKSGGIDRDWVGVPRLLKPVGQKNAFCVCIRDRGPPTLGHTTKDDNRGDLDYPYLKEYEGCDSKSDSCKVVNSK